jgi:hypothetical protein
MYRKIFVILIIIVDQIDLQLKAHILFMLSFIFLILNTSCSPFLKRRLNTLESLSNLSVFLIFGAGSLFLNGESNSIKFISYGLIFSLNISYTIFWIFSIISTFFQAYRNTIIERCRKFFSNRFVFREILFTASKTNKNDIKISFTIERPIVFD